MRETYLDLPSRLEDAFPEIDNDIMMELRNENEEYLELLQKISDLLSKSHTVRILIKKGIVAIRIAALTYHQKCPDQHQCPKNPHFIFFSHKTLYSTGSMPK